MFTSLPFERIKAAAASPNNEYVSLFSGFSPFEDTSAEINKMLVAFDSASAVESD